MVRLFLVLLIAAALVPSVSVAAGCDEPSRPRCMATYQYRSARGDVNACAAKIFDYFEALMLWKLCLAQQFGVAERMIADVLAQQDCLRDQREICKLTYRLWTAPEQSGD